jgi:glucokinase
MTIGLDLGGTKIQTALVDAAGRIMVSRRQPTNPEKGPDEVIANIVASVKACLGEAGKTVQGLGVGVAGQLDRTGTLRFSPNLPGWRNVPLKVELEDALAMPVVITNDVRAATWGEWRHGTGQDVDDMVCLFVGTGIGGGVVSGGRLMDGCSNTAGELGHMTIVADGRRCHCPNRGCLEAYAGGWAIAERAQQAVDADPQAGQRLIVLAGDVQQISAATVTHACSDGDPLACRLVEETTQYLAAGVVGIVNAFNPCLLVLGGGVIQGRPEYVPTVERLVRKNALQTAVEGSRIVIAALGNKAGVIGAAALARDMIGKAAWTA